MYIFFNSLVPSVQNGKTPLILSKYTDNYECVTVDLNKGDDSINLDNKLKSDTSFTNINHTKVETNNELLTFCEKGDKEKVRLLLTNTNININYQDDKGYSALHYACDEGNLKICKMLLEKGINVHLKTSKNQTALHLASKNGFFDISKLLIEYGAEINVLDSDKNLPIHLCAKINHNELLTYFLERYNGIDCKNILGQTPFDLLNADTKKLMIKYKKKKEKKNITLIKIRNVNKNQTNELVKGFDKSKRLLSPNNYRTNYTQSQNSSNNKLIHSMQVKNKTNKNDKNNLTKQQSKVLSSYKTNSVKTEQIKNNIIKRNSIKSNQLKKIMTNVLSSNTNKSQNKLKSGKEITKKYISNFPKCLNTVSSPENKNISGLANKFGFKKEEHTPQKFKEETDKTKNTLTNRAISLSKQKSDIKKTISLPRFIEKNEKKKITLNKNQKKGITNNNSNKNINTNESPDTIKKKSQRILNESCQINLDDSIDDINEKKNYFTKSQSKKVFYTDSNKQNTDRPLHNKKFEFNLGKLATQNKKDSKINIDLKCYNSKNTLNTLSKKMKSKQEFNKIKMINESKKNSKKTKKLNIPNYNKKELKTNKNHKKSEINSFNELDEDDKETSNNKMKVIDLILDEDSKKMKIEDLNSEDENETKENHNYTSNEQNIKSLISVSSSSSANLSSSQNQSNQIKKVGPSSFECLGLLGEGSFGEVYLVEMKDNHKKFAMKVLDKEQIMSQNIFKYAMTERNVLSITSHPFIVKLNYAFQTSEKLFLLLDYCPNGDLARQLEFQKNFSEDKAKFYLCEIILAIGDLHEKDIIFRDLKPDNVVLNEEGHALLTDFGLSREGVNNPNKAQSFCGSIAYLAPEMINRTGHGKSVDWYLVGVLFYEMLVGAPPFFTSNKNQIFKNIKKGELNIPSFISPKAAILLRQLLKKNPNERLGAKGDVDEIKIHPYFSDVNWDDVYNKRIKPPSITGKGLNVQYYEEPRQFLDDEDYQKEREKK